MPTSIIIRWTLASAMACTIVGCDDETSGPTGELDRRAAQEHLETRVDDEAEPVSFEVVDELVIGFEDATVRDIVDGRIDAPMISADFGRVDELGDITESCPQQEATLGGAPVEQPRHIEFDVADELLLDTPLSEACVLADHRSGGVQLVRCEDFAGPGARATLDADFELVYLDSTAYDCYFCTSTFVCGWGGKQEKRGWVIDGKCAGWGFFGCC